MGFRQCQPRICQTTIRWSIMDGDMLNVKQQSDGKAGNLYLKLSASKIRSPAPIAEVRKKKAIIWKVIIPVFILVATLMGVFGYIYLFKRIKASKKGKYTFSSLFFARILHHIKTTVLMFLMDRQKEMN